jgi:hypothetical protein
MILARTESNGQRFYSVSSEINNEKSAYYDEERISDIDWLRFSQKEVTLQDLADKYFAFLKMG